MINAGDSRALAATSASPFMLDDELLVRAADIAEFWELATAAGMTMDMTAIDVGPVDVQAGDYADTMDVRTFLERKLPRRSRWVRVVAVPDGADGRRWDTADTWIQRTAAVTGVHQNRNERLANGTHRNQRLSLSRFGPLALAVFISPVPLLAEDIIYTEGQSEVRYADGEQQEAQIGDVLITGDSVRTGDDGLVELDQQSATIRIAPGTVFTISETVDAGGPRSTIGEHLHPSATDFGALQSSTPWEASPLRTDNRDFSWTAAQTTDNADGTFDVTGTLSSLSGANEFTDALFTMEEDEQDNWKVRLLDLDTNDALTTWDITKVQ